MVIEKQVAIKIVNDWLESRDAEAFIPHENSDAAEKANYAKLVKAVEKGLLSFDADGRVTQTLKFPKTGEIKLLELNYSPRVTIVQRNNLVKGIKKDDNASALSASLAMAGALTEVSASILEQLNSEDGKLIDILTGIFFM